MFWYEARSPRWTMSRYCVVWTPQFGGAQRSIPIQWPHGASVQPPFWPWTWKGAACSWGQHAFQCLPPRYQPLPCPATHPRNPLGSAAPSVLHSGVVAFVGNVSLMAWGAEKFGEEKNVFFRSYKLFFVNCRAQRNVFRTQYYKVTFALGCLSQ